MSTYAHGFRLRRPHIHRWLAAVIALAAALIGLSVWVIIDQTNSEAVSAAKPTSGLASSAVTSMLDARIVALNSAGKQPLARFYSRDAILEEFDVVPSIVTRGGVNVAGHLEGYSRLWAMQGSRVSREGPVIQLGNFASHTIRFGSSTGVTVVELDQNGKILHQWAFA